MVKRWRRSKISLSRYLIKKSLRQSLFSVRIWLFINITEYRISAQCNMLRDFCLDRSAHFARFILFMPRNSRWGRPTEKYLILNGMHRSDSANIPSRIRATKDWLERGQLAATQSVISFFSNPPSVYHRVLTSPAKPPRVHPTRYPVPHPPLPSSSITEHVSSFVPFLLPKWIVQVNGRTRFYLRFLNLNKRTFYDKVSRAFMECLKKYMNL